MRLDAYLKLVCWEAPLTAVTASMKKPREQMMSQQASQQLVSEQGRPQPSQQLVSEQGRPQPSQQLISEQGQPRPSQQLVSEQGRRTQKQAKKGGEGEEPPLQPDLPLAEDATLRVPVLCGDGPTCGNLVIVQGQQLQVRAPHIHTQTRLRLRLNLTRFII